MSRTASVLLPLFAMAALLPGLAQDRNPSTPTADRAADTRSQPGKSTEDVLVTVNGTPIGEADVRYALSTGGHNTEIPPKQRKNVLEVIIQQELVYQRAVELGLDANAGYQKKLRQMEAQLNAFKRKELSELFWRENAGRAVVSEAEAKKYFEENAARIQTELHVWQILKRQERLIQKTLSEVEHGASFDEVARRQFPNLPEGAGQPWDLGYLKWKQVPEAWRNVVYDLKKGEVSGVIRGPNSRFWIIKLMDKRENPDITFESIKPTIMEVLKNEKIEELRAQAARDLRAKASIVYMQGSAEASEE
jgi:peptidyl-prolyl cis-trans isomerase C